MEFFCLALAGVTVVLCNLWYRRHVENMKVRRATRQVREAIAAYPALSTEPGPMDITYGVGDVRVTEYRCGAYSLEAQYGETIPPETLLAVVPHDLLAKLFGPNGFGSR